MKLLIGKVNVVPVPPPPPPPGVNEDSSSDSDLGPDLAHLGRPQAAVQGNNTPMQVASTAIQIYEREPNGYVTVQDSFFNFSVLSFLAVLHKIRTTTSN